MRKKHRPVSSINVTPMVDVMLVLLIVFMVTAPLLTVGVPVNLPKVEANSLDAQKEPLEILLLGEYPSKVPKPTQSRIGSGRSTWVQALGKRPRNHQH